MQYTSCKNPEAAKKEKRKVKNGRVCGWILACACMCASCAKKTKEETESFSTLMGFDKSSWKFVTADYDYNHMQFFQNLYDKYKTMIFESEAEESIPKMIHFIWIGNAQLSKESVKNIRHWIEHHPDWKIVYWTDRRRPLPHPKVDVRFVDEFEFIKLKSCFDRSDNYGEKSLLLRYEILYQEGGVYADHDVMCFRPFDPFHRLDFYCGLAPADCPILESSISTCTSIIGARPGHPILKKTMDLVRRYWDEAEELYGGATLDATLRRVSCRSTLCLDEAIRLMGDQEDFRNIVLPTGYFNRIDGEFGLYAHHNRVGAWLGHETRFEQYARGKLAAISQKSQHLFFFVMLAVVCNGIFCLALLFCYFSLKKAMKEPTSKEP